ncbi:MAG TPA: MFS transporter, partial [Streptosporangiaceae bacterium]
MAVGIPNREAAGPRTAGAGAVFTVVVAAIFMSNLDLFIVNVALPSIGRDFGGSSLAGLSWVLNAYAIVFAALLVPAGRLGDR